MQNGGTRKPRLNKRHGAVLPRERRRVSRCFFCSRGRKRGGANFRRPTAHSSSDDKRFGVRGVGTPSAEVYRARCRVKKTGSVAHAVGDPRDPWIRDRDIVGGGRKQQKTSGNRIGPLRMQRWWACRKEKPDPTKDQPKLSQDQPTPIWNRLESYQV